MELQLDTLTQNKLIEVLSKIDTPTLSNAVEMLKIRKNNEGFCNREIKCLFPDLGVNCGFVVTAQVRTMQDHKEPNHYGMIELCEALEAAPEPRVIVFEELSPYKEFCADVPRIK